MEIQAEQIVWQNKIPTGPDRQLLIIVEIDHKKLCMGAADLVGGLWENWADKFKCKKNASIIEWAEMPEINRRGVIDTMEVDYVKYAEEAGAVIEEMKYDIEQAIKELEMQTNSIPRWRVIDIVKRHLTKYLDPEEAMEKKIEELKPIVISSKKICGSWGDLINGEIVTSLNITPDGISAVVGYRTTYKLSPDQFGELKFINDKACSECGRSFEDD